MADPTLNPPIPGLGQSLLSAANVQSGLNALPTPSIAMPNFGGAPAISAPSLMPMAPSAAIASSPNVGTSQLQRDNDRLNMLRSTGAGVDQIHNPFLHGLAKAGDIASQIAGSVFLPARAISAAIPGTTFHHQLLVNQAQQNLANDQAEAQKAAQTADMASQTSERESLGKKADALAAADTPMPITPELAEAAGAPQLAGISMTPKDYQRLVANHQTVQGHITTNQNTNDTRVQTTGMNNDTSRDNNTATNTSREGIAAAADKTRTLIAQMHDATSQANNQNTNNHKVGTGTAGGGAFKVPADVTKRAALASNVTENADAVDALLQRNPAIVGKTGGRYSTVQQMIGSDDPDIAELGVRMHNIALASNGAHGVRAAQAIAQTENELFHNFTSGPNAIHSALNATRGSMKTFLDDEKNYQTSGNRAGSGDGNKSGDPLGVR